MSWYFLSLQLKISDMTGEHWITCFQNTAEVILGRSADELGAIKESKVRFFDFQEVYFI